MVGGVLAVPEPSQNPAPFPEWITLVTEWLKDNVYEGKEEGTDYALTFRQAFDDGDEDAIDAPLNDVKTTALHVASIRGAPHIVTLLLDNHANVNAKDTYGDTPLHDASIQGKNDVIPVLLENKADVHAKNNEDQTPLHYASDGGSTDIVTLLLDNHATVNAKDANGDTPLHYASIRGKNDVIPVLLKNKADVHAKNNYGKTPLHYASDGGSTDIETKLQEAAAELARTKKNLRIKDLNEKVVKCPICLSGLKCTDEEIRLCIICKGESGIFHKDCIQQCLKEKIECPTCRQTDTIF